MKTEVPKKVAVLVRVPRALLKQLDTAARIGERSRSREVCVRLADSLKRSRAGGGVA